MGQCSSIPPRTPSFEAVADAKDKCPVTGASGAGCPFLSAGEQVVQGPTRSSQPGNAELPCLLSAQRSRRQSSDAWTACEKAGLCSNAQATSKQTGLLELFPKKQLHDGVAARQKILVAELPVVAEETLPSVETSEALSASREWPPVQALSEEDIVVVKGAWNRITAWKDATIEAMVYRWIALVPELYDVLQVKFDELAHDLFTLIDKSVRALDSRTDVHHRESYTADFPACVKRDFGSDPSEILFHYTLLGVRFKHWARLKESFLFALTTHNPYLYQDHDGVDLNQGDDGALARFFHIHIVARAGSIFQKHVARLQSPAAKVMQRQALVLKGLPQFGLSFRERLLDTYPELCDYFAGADGDFAGHIQAALVVLGSSGVGLCDSQSALAELAQVHRQSMIPTEAYAQFGEVLQDVLAESFEMSAEVLGQWVYLYMCCATVVSAPVAVRERLLSEAREFFEQLAKEEGWGPVQLEARLKQVEVEVGLRGTYSHTAEELQAGARMAWRNSSKCIGRIAWNTLLVRDRRHLTTAQEFFEECKEHLKRAAGSGVVQSLMTVFAPREPTARWGARFWNSQFCRYAGYRQPDGSVLGDPANVDFTEMAIKEFGWTPPTKRTRFDPLPQIVQMPDEEPAMCEFPRELFREVQLSHPKFSKFASLGLKWTSIPAINNFNFRLGGVDYPCCPFNGWFVDLEIARNLVERYGVGPEVAKVCGFDTSSDSSGWRSMVLQAVSCAVTHSFQRRKVSIVDHYTASCQFLTHVDREKRAGREVPAQWSWIGGFAGVHCPVWGYEMRDFYLRPQFQYTCNRWVVDRAMAGDGDVAKQLSQASAAIEDVRRVLILFSSTTGTSERFARTVAKELGHSYRPKVMELNSFNEDMASRFSHILACVATFNDGGAPANGSQFPAVLPFRLVDTRTGRPIKYALFCLGSSVYPKFCAFGKRVDETFKAAGGLRFTSNVLSDETRGHLASFQKFLSAMRVELEPRRARAGAVEQVLEVRLLPGSGRVESVDGDAFAERQGHRRATVLRSQVLFDSFEEDRCARQISIDLAECPDMSYSTGGHLSVLPCNPDEEVARLCEALGIPEEQRSCVVQAETVEGKERLPADIGFDAAPLSEVLKWRLDITLRPSNLAAILGMLKDVGGLTAEEHGELSREEQETVAVRFWWVSELLRAYPRTRGKVTLAALFTTLGKQFPRLYSVASSSSVSGSVAELCVSLVTVGRRRGLASGYLHGLGAGSSVYVATQPSSFCLPSSPEAPLLMVAVGTGVAPFAAFAQERTHLASAREGEAQTAQTGPAKLFTGCRKRAERICNAVFEEALLTGALHTYCTALSREVGVKKQHVTDMLCLAADDVWTLMRQPNCHYYFCGDGHSADSAYDALLSSIMQATGMSRVKSEAVLSRMQAEGRYHLDIWGVVSHRKAAGALRQHRPQLAKTWRASVRTQCDLDPSSP